MKTAISRTRKRLKIYIASITLIVRYTAVFSVVTQRSSPQGALRDDTKNGCVVDYHLKRCATKWKENTWSTRCACSSLFFDVRRLCQQLNNCFVLNASQHRQVFLIVLVKCFSADTFSRTVCSIYSHKFIGCFAFASRQACFPEA